MQWVLQRLMALSGAAEADDDDLDDDECVDPVGIESDDGSELVMTSLTRWICGFLPSRGYLFLASRCSSSEKMFERVLGMGSNEKANSDVHYYCIIGGILLSPNSNV
ncbi:hypothetical protein RJZ56_005206 [Blastomyces dermatitidis]|nr:hypothetical protein BDDG_06736 [Blastomyces dermatitidis ATCC 18188]